MKKLLFLLSASLLMQTGFSQTSFKTIRGLEPVWGHYKKIQAYPANPQPGNENTDARKYELNSKHRAVTDLAATEVFGNGRISKSFYLKGNEGFDFPEPPANSSLQTRAELDYLLQLQQQRSEEDIRASKFYAKVYYRTAIQPGDKDYAVMRRNLFHIGRSIGTWFNADSLPLTAQLVVNTWKDAEFLIWKYKNYHLRIRPYKLDTAIHNLEETDWAAYPSGHATNSYVNAFLYSELLPEFTSFFMKDAYDMAHSREIIGVHYPSDSESGRVLARQLINRLMENENFKKDFEAAKREIRQVQSTKGF